MNKQETAEEAAEKYSKTFIEDDGTTEVDFIAGAKWQAERMYSEEDMITFGEFMQQRHTGVKESFEQFKKKV